MPNLEGIYRSLGEFIPLLVTIAVIAVGLWFANWLLLRRASLTTETRLPGQVTMLVLTIISLVAVILALPVSESTHGDLLSLLGLLLTGVIALSSTSFVANAMAGLMLRAVKSFHHGDFIHAGEHFGRVTERGLFHTEIQSENRDLITLPNLFLASNPVTVVRSSGTIVSCDLSLGYDVPHYEAEPLLKLAAEGAGLQEPFVQIRTLGDFSVSYRISGYYPEVKHLLTTRSRLRREVLDHLHGAGIEIVSPSFMNQRQFRDGEKFMASPPHVEAPLSAEQAPESMIFDKADRAEKIHNLEAEAQVLVGEIKALKEELPDVEEERTGELQSEIQESEARLSTLENIIRKAKEKPNE
ncbi:MAG: mechanosensitive ion channel [Porticoccaceae bacterium]